MSVTRLDRVRNADIRNESEIESLINKIQQGQLMWFGHVIKMKGEHAKKYAKQRHSREE